MGRGSGGAPGFARQIPLSLDSFLQLEVVQPGLRRTKRIDGLSMAGENDDLALLAGLNIMTGTETMIKSFETVLRPTVKFSGRIGERVSLFLAAGFSLLDIMYAPGFEKPLVRIPDQNYLSILTGCRAGAAVRLD